MGRINLWVLCGLALLAVSSFDFQVRADVIPSVDECRPYIEKAINELKTAEVHTESDRAELEDPTSVQDSVEEPIIESQSAVPAESAPAEDDDGESTEQPESPSEQEQESTEDDQNQTVEDKTVEEGEDKTAEDDGQSVEGDSVEQPAETKEEENQTDEEGDSKEQTETKEEENTTDEDGDSKEQTETDTQEQKDDEDSKEQTAEKADDGDSQEQTAEDGDSKEDENAEDGDSKEATTAEEGDSKEADEKLGEADNDTAEEQSVEEPVEEKQEESGEDTEEKKTESIEEAEDKPAQSGEDTEEKTDDSEEKPAAESNENDDDKTEEEKSAEKVEDDQDSVEDKTVEDTDGDSKEDDEDKTVEDTDGDSKEAADETDGDSNEDKTGEETDGDSQEDDNKTGEDVDGDSKEETQDSAEEKPQSAEENEESNEQDDTAEKTDTEEASAEEQQDDDDTESEEKVRSKRSVTDEAQTETEEEESTEGEGEEADQTESGEENAEEDSGEEEEEESMPEEDLTLEFEIPKNLRDRSHITELLGLDELSSIKEAALKKTGDVILKELKGIYDKAIKPLETLFKYRDLSNRHFGDPEIFSKPLILFMGPWSGGKSTILNYLTGNEYTPTSIRSGAEPSPAYFNLMMYGDEPEVLDGTQLAADWTFAGLQKFGQGLNDRLRGHKLPNKLLERVNIVEIPGILEVRKQVSKYFPFNDACQWFIDRADIIFLTYDPSKLDVGPETEAILDQLKGREYQTRILLNKADQVKPEELLRVQSALIWNISPLMSSAQPPVMYTVSLWSHPFETGAPTRLLQAQERAFLTDLREAIDKRIENKIASARRFAVRIRNHAKMVDCYLTTYYNQKTLFSNKKQVADKIIEHPQNFNIYEGLSTLTNISRYDLPDPEVYMDFFRLNPLYEFKRLSETCTYFKGCPIQKLDIAIAYDLPELVGKYKKILEQNMITLRKEYEDNCNTSETEPTPKILKSR